jgi:hypothetical protein
MATVLDRVPVDEITAQAREVRFGRTLLTVLAAVLYFVFGWLPGKIWLALCWCGVAIRTGWRDARRPPDRSG